MRKPNKLTILSAALGLPLAGSLSAATMIQVDFSSVGPVAFAPALVTAHDGSYDFFDTGSAASNNLRTLAETGNPSDLVGALPAAVNRVVITGTSGPPTGVGATSTGQITVDDGNNRLSLASMALPSNDWFIGNNDPNSMDISSLLTAANGTSIMFVFSRVYDAGTEINDFNTAPGGPLVGAPGGMTGGPGMDAVENANITLVTGPDPFGSFLNQGSFDTTALDFTGGNVATITLTVVPEPSSATLVGLGALALILRRKRN